MAKRKRKKRVKKSKTKSSNILKYIVWVLSLIALVMSAILIGYYFTSNKTESQQLQKEQEKAVPQKPNKDSAADKESNKSVTTKLHEVLKKEISQKKKEQVKEKYISASHEIDKSVAKPPKAIDRPVKLSSKKPRLAIIIDDVGSKGQVKNIKNVGLLLNMSFLPPSKYRPNTPKLAAKQNFYMVHLPMEAKNWNKEEPFTLRVDDSQEQITERISKIKELFPKVKYINNHTGSKFTSSEDAMNRLMYVLNSHGINFIDSRTTGDTKVPKVMKNLGLKYVARDIFLDHHMDKSYVLSQIKKAIKIAKLHGTAVAIGHPHPNTLSALEESKKLFKSVELVYVNKLY